MTTAALRVVTYNLCEGGAESAWTPSSLFYDANARTRLASWKLITEPISTHSGASCTCR